MITKRKKRVLRVLSLFFFFSLRFYSVSIFSPDSGICLLKMGERKRVELGKINN